MQTQQELTIAKEKGMKLKKWLIGIGILCAVAALIVFYTLAYRGWNWDLPQSLLSRIDFKQLSENIDRLEADGYTRLNDASIGESSYYVFGRADDENATPMIYVWCSKDLQDEAGSGEISCKATTSFTDLSVGNKDHYRFLQEVLIRQDGGRIWMSYYTEKLFAGHQQVIDYLSQFCDRYCTP